MRAGIPPSQRPKVWLKMAHLHLERETAPEPIEACMEVPHHTDTHPPTPGGRNQQTLFGGWDVGIGPSRACEYHRRRWIRGAALQTTQRRRSPSLINPNLNLSPTLPLGCLDHAGEYEIVQSIEKDLGRTFPDSVLFGKEQLEAIGSPSPETRTLKHGT